MAAITACSEAVSTRAAPHPASPASGLVKRVQAPTVQYVKLEQVREMNGQPWASMAEFNLIDSTGASVDRKAWTASADSATSNDTAARAIDGDPNSQWHTPWEGTPPKPPHAWVVSLGGKVKISGFRYLPRQDKSSNGTIADYRFYVSNDGVSWGEPVVMGSFSNMGAPADEKTVVFAEQTENHAPGLVAPTAQSTGLGQAASLQLVASDADADGLVYAASGLPPGLNLFPVTGLIKGTPLKPGTYTVTALVKDSKGLNTSTSFEWVITPSIAAASAVQLQPGEVRFVRLDALSEVNAQPWSSIAEFQLIDAKGNTLDRSGWLASADSSDTSDMPVNAIDGDPASIWHSQWDGASPGPPHSLIVDLGRGAQVRGFRYLPRQDPLSNGAIAKFRFYTSVNGIDWGMPVAEGDFSTQGAARAEKTVRLK
jgi:hypothetical protein